MNTINIHEFLNEERETIKVDRAFQRKSCWSLEQKRRFILSFLRKRTPYPIVLADIKTGIKQSKKQSDYESLAKYEGLIGYEKISLDGQNRVQTLHDFYNNDFSITGRLIGADGKEYPVTNCYYKDLPIRVKDAFDMLGINVDTMKNCLYSELHKIFVDINDGEGLNEQEKRNAIMTWFSNYIRTFSEAPDNAKLLLRISGISEQDIARSKDAEWFTKVYASLLRPNKHHLHQAGLDNFYRQGEGMPQSTIDDYSLANVVRFQKVIAMVHKAVFRKSTVGTQVSQKLFWALVAAASDVYDDGNQIHDYVKFFNAVKNADDIECLESQELFAKRHRKWFNVSDNPLPAPKRSQYYFHWASDVNKPTARMKRKQSLLLRLTKIKDYIDSWYVETEQSEEA